MMRTDRWAALVLLAACNSSAGRAPTPHPSGNEIGSGGAPGSAGAPGGALGAGGVSGQGGGFNTGGGAGVRSDAGSAGTGGSVAGRGGTGGGTQVDAAVPNAGGTAGSLNLPTGAAAVLTQHNDNARSGWNPKETVLTHAALKSGKFQKLFELPVGVTGQVLFVPGLTIQGKSHNVIFFWDSASNSVYAYDADTLGPALWKSIVQSNADGYGMCATPAIDIATRTMYVLSKSRTNVQQIHALDLLTGMEKAGSPTQVTAPGFNSGGQNSWPGLLFQNVGGTAVIYFAYAHHTDQGSYHGWVFGYSYDQVQFTQKGVFNDTADLNQGGIWAFGKGLVADSSNNVYCSTGNGPMNAHTGGKSYSMSVVKLDALSLAVVDWFSPWNEAQLSGTDQDMEGTLLIPGTRRVFSGMSKAELGYLVDGDAMGHFVPAGKSDADSQCLQTVSKGGTTSPVAWDTGSVKYVYLNPGVVQQYRYDPTYSAMIRGKMVGGLFTNPHGGNLDFNPDPYKVSTLAVSQGSHDHASMAITSNGASDAVLWVFGNGLTAFDANDVSQPPLYKDNTAGTGNCQFGTVVNGKVYVPHNSSTTVMGLAAQ